MLEQHSKQLLDFQQGLSGRGQAKVHIPIADKVIGSIAELEEKNSSLIGRMTDIARITANRYVRGETSPRLVVLVRMLDKLGYDLYIVKKPDKK